MRREPALGIGGLPGKKIYDGDRLLGTITRRGNYSFYWLAENAWITAGGRCVRARSSGTVLSSEEAERSILNAFGLIR